MEHIKDSYYMLVTSWNLLSKFDDFSYFFRSKNIICRIGIATFLVTKLETFTQKQNVD
jgi:hypothetical protein